LILMAWAYPSAAAERQRVGIDVVLVIDGSRSMKRNDPQNLRQVGAREFIDLAGDGDRLALVEFAGKPRTLAPLTPLRDEATRQQLQAKVDQISSNGNETNIAAAIAHAYHVLEAGGDPTHNQYVLFLTDGQIDLDAGIAAERASERKLRRETLAQFQKRGWVIYTVGLSTEVDRELMRDLVEATKKRVGPKVKGLHETTPTAKDIPPVYARIMAQMVDWVTLGDPGAASEFTLNPDVDDRATVTVNKRGGGRPTLTLPNGQQVTAGNAADFPGLRWQETSDYTIVHLDQPERGPYKMDADGGTVQGFVESPVWLRLSDVKRQVEEQEAVRLVATLMKNSTPLGRAGPRRRKLEMFARVLIPGGGVRTLRLGDNGLSGDEKTGDGNYTGYFVGTAARGEYTVTARARADFSRTSDPQVFRVVRPASVDVRPDREAYRWAAPIGLRAGLTDRAAWSSEPRFEATAFPPTGQHRTFALLADGPPGAPRRKEGPYRGLFGSTDVEGEYAFVVTARGRTATGQSQAVTRYLTVPVSPPDLVIAPVQAAFGALTAKTRASRTFTARSHLGRDERLRAGLSQASGVSPDGLAVELVQNGREVEEVLVRPGLPTPFEVRLKTRQRTTASGEPVAAAALLHFTPTRKEVSVRPAEVPIEFTLIPLPPWWRFWWRLLKPFLAALGLGLALRWSWITATTFERLPEPLYLLTRPRLRGKLHVTGPGHAGETFPLGQRGLWRLLRKSRLLGSDPRCDLVVPGIQAKVWRDRIGRQPCLAVRDLTKETKPVRYLLAGEELSLGPCRLRYEDAQF
jgi:hypothetical protein